MFSKLCRILIIFNFLVIQGSAFANSVKINKKSSLRCPRIIKMGLPLAALLSSNTYAKASEENIKLCKSKEIEGCIANFKELFESAVEITCKAEDDACKKEVGIHCFDKLTEECLNEANIVCMADANETPEPPACRTFFKGVKKAIILVPTGAAVYTVCFKTRGMDQALSSFVLPLAFMASSMVAEVVDISSYFVCN